MFMNKIARYTPSRSEASMFFIRLETQLQIKDAQFKQLRRLILDWGDLKYSQNNLL